MIEELEKYNTNEKESKFEDSMIYKIEEIYIFLEEIVKLEKQLEYQPFDFENLIK